MAVGTYTPYSSVYEEVGLTNAAVSALEGRLGYSTPTEDLPARVRTLDRFLVSYASGAAASAFGWGFALGALAGLAVGYLVGQKVERRRWQSAAATVGRAPRARWGRA